MRKFIIKTALAVLAACTVFPAQSQNREEHLINSGWKFAFGHAQQVQANFMAGTQYFNYLTKTGYGDGPANPAFDDRPWRSVDIPHDWAVELPFSPDASHSHGYKCVGWAFPEYSVGWYRKTINIPQKDLGKKISLLFEGIFRNSEVWVNGFYLGCEQSGYLDFQYDITDYLNYGADNVITVKADASLEEGWFYEGAGIYRNVWLIKTDPVHVAKDGIFVTTNINGSNADVAVRVDVDNADYKAHDVRLSLTVKDAMGKPVASTEASAREIRAMDSHKYCKELKVSGIKLWQPDAPAMYTLEVKVVSDAEQVDCKQVRFGFRTLEFTSDKGFFINGKHLKIVGVNIHQDFAGVGCAINKPLQIERVKMLKSWGFNGIRTSHNPVNVDLLDVCDSLGMVVLEETRLEGINDYHKSQLRRMIERDRNHPSIIAWSVGNEEWRIESNILGERITKTMQAYAKTIDSTRMYTVAVSGGCGYGSSESIELMGFNYLAQCDIDTYHAKHASQPGWLTEETSGCGARGIYWADSARCHIPQFDRAGGTSIERGYAFCMDRDWMSGLFYWTGFDYRGESTPFSYPANGSYFGILDQCGFPKDAAYYILANRSQKPMVHLFPHWNHAGHEGQMVDVWAYSNCDELELILNKKSMGKQPVPKYGHCAWKVEYQPGTIMVKAYKNGVVQASEELRTSGQAAQVQLQANKTTVSRKSEDVLLVQVQALDAKGLPVPDAAGKIKFSVQGPAQILGVGNGDPSCLENDREYAQGYALPISARQELTVSNLDNWKAEMDAAASDSWRKALHTDRSERWNYYHDSLLVVRCDFDISDFAPEAAFTLYSKSILHNQSIYVNGVKVAGDISRDAPQQYQIDRKILHEGRNEVIFVGKKFRKAYEWDEPNTDPGCVGVSIPAAQYQRSLFGGKALLVVRTSGKPGAITITAKGDGIREGKLVVK
ncbi:MAG: DUF4982 domain-containing protein [Bacteroidales bacterium]|nr:DUF4982 domain-containing protein [Bacteroidales bacterium]